MGHGGSRPGAGRPRGSRLGLAKEIVEKHVKDMGIDIPEHIARMTPLEVMLRAMTLEASKQRWSQAAALAKEAAPYLHPKLSSVEMNANVRRTAEDFSDQELLAIAGPDWGDEGAEETPEGA